MDSTVYILLGIIQGLTEFLPVSSSGHLVIARSFIEGFQQPGLLFDISVHFATFCAVIIYFRKKILLLLKSFLGAFLPKYRITYFENKNMLWGIVIASIPTAIIGLYFENFADVLFSSTVYVGYALILTSILLVLSDKKKSSGVVTYNKSFLLGIIQGFAVIPGISRSGSTIAIAVLLNINRKDAAEFSFLMALPAVFGATLLQVKYIDTLESILITPYLLAMLSAFISGFVAIFLMMKLVRSAKLTYFAIYCLAIGIISIIWL